MHLIKHPHVLPFPFPEKNQRLKEAKEEAGMEIEAYRKERESQFKEKQKNVDGSKGDYTQKMEEEKVEKLDTIRQDIARNKQEVIKRLLNMVYDIKPELHQNKRVE